MRYWAALLLLAGAPVRPAHAQAYQCTAPAGPIPVPQVRQDGPTRHAAITGYTLALTWAPEFCHSHTPSRASSRECSGREGNFGLVVHGLWPEGHGTRYPQWCSPGRAVTAADIRPYLCMTPSAYLLAHEWARHGSCMARRPAAYFARARTLWQSLRLPDLDRLSRKKGLTAGDLRHAFADANPGWHADMIALKVSKRGWLEEIHLCYTRRFKPSPCASWKRGPSDNDRLRIWRGL